MDDVKALVDRLNSLWNMLRVSRLSLESDDADPPEWTWQEQHDVAQEIRSIADALSASRPSGENGRPGWPDGNNIVRWEIGANRDVRGTVPTARSDSGRAPEAADLPRRDAARTDASLMRGEMPRSSTWGDIGPSGEDAPREFAPDWDRLAAAEDSLREHMAEVATLRAQLAEARDTIDTMKRQASDSMVMAMIEADRHVLREKLAAERTKAETLAREHAALVAVVRELIGSWRKKTPNYTAWDDAADELAAALLAHPLPDAPSGSGQP